VRTKTVGARRQQLIFHPAVWVGRAIGWVLLVIAVFGLAEARLLPAIMGNFKFLPSLALGLVAVVWIAGLELFLHFFDRYLSGN
jgi:hypothetical protein